MCRAGRSAIDDFTGTDADTSKMLDHNVLVRKAEGIETAGSLNILFSDKTGTITKGSLEVVEFFTADGKTFQ